MVNSQELVRGGELQFSLQSHLVSLAQTQRDPA